MKRLVVLVLSIVLYSCNDEDNSTLSPQNFGEELREMAPSLLSRFNVNGLAVGFIHDGQVVLNEGFGFADRSTQKEVTTRTIFNIGSVSKIFAGWGAMRLAREGKISLNSPIEEILTRWSFPRSSFDHSKVTLSRLMSHTGGTSLAGFPGYELGSLRPSLEGTLSGEGNAGEDVRIVYDPGSQIQYSGGGITVIQLAIEEVSGQSFSNFMVKEIFQPLDMASSGFDYTSTVLQNIATPYDRERNQVAHREFTALGAAGMLTTLDDLVTFSMKVIGETQGISAGVPGVDNPTIESILGNGTDGSLIYSVAHQVRKIGNVTIMGHTGTNTGWRCHLQIAPQEGHAIITMTNGSSGGPDNEIICRWLQEITGVTSSEFCG